MGFKFLQPTPENAVVSVCVELHVTLLFRSIVLLGSSVLQVKVYAR